jgi:hypothetical protein
MDIGCPKGLDALAATPRPSPQGFNCLYLGALNVQQFQPFVRDEHFIISKVKVVTWDHRPG